MGLLDSLGVGFFNTVEYKGVYLLDDLGKDNSWLSQMETAADVCRAPSRWFAAECWGGGKTCMISRDTEKGTKAEFHFDEKKTQLSQGIQKVLRIIVGLLLGLPGQLFAVPLMAIAYRSEEIRLKHKLSVKSLTPDEHKKLNDLIEERQELAKGRQGNAPRIYAICLLFSIFCLLCCLAARRK